jgi:tetratricopeptide (TPR) repeat protein
MVTTNILTKSIPTYELGKSEINPVFFEKRVYQGSSGKVYPVPFIDKVYDHVVDKKYQLATIENEFVRLAMLPEIGGRIFEAQDKTNNDYNFFYKQEVIKPALVGLAGPWLSGGVEFNWPQHHRPGTYLPTDTFIEKESDGAYTVWMSEYDPMYRLKGMHGIRLRPGSSLIELRGRLYNRTALTQTFLWWANVAVEVHKDYESFFPPDVHYVADHAVRAMTSFPHAQNSYYGIPYDKRPGKNDLRKYENITVPTSYMVCDTKYDFFGGYDHKADGGFIHVANRHIAPGKKQWTWGSEEFGKAWDRELTDIGGPYFELMAGVYTDNQPDFSYLLPFETKTFSQYWWSYKKLGPVQNANREVAIKLLPKQGNKVEIGVVSSSLMNNLTVIIDIASKHEKIDSLSIGPETPWLCERTFSSGEENRLSLTVLDESGKTLLSYSHKEIDKSRDRKVAFEPKQPEELDSSIKLNMIGEHLELYRHPTRYPEPYWEEAIKRDPNNFSAHISLSKVLIKSGLFEKAKDHAFQAIDILTTYHPNPSTGEAHYYHGIACYHLGEVDIAYKSFYKATWNYEWRSPSFYMLARIDSRNNDFELALEHLDAALVTNTHNNSAVILKAVILNKLNRESAAEELLTNLLAMDPLDQWANFELGRNRGNYDDFINSSRNDAQTIIDIAFEYISSGNYKPAIDLIELHHNSPPKECAVPNPMGQSVMTEVILSWLYFAVGNEDKGDGLLSSICKKSFDYFFPSRLEEMKLLEWIANNRPNFTIVYYGLGNFYFNAKRHQDAIQIWERAVAAGCQYATLYRNLGIAYWNANQDGERAIYSYEKAIEQAPDDMRIQFEYDQLRKKLNHDPMIRLKDLLALKDKVFSRDDFSVELATLYNLTDQSEKALQLLVNRNFHPWEGGEGQVLKQYTYACIKLGILAIRDGDPQKALTLFNESIDTPDNLGEKYHPLQAVAHVNYWKGRAYSELGNELEALKHFQASADEEGDFIDMAVSSFSELTYFKALSMIELGKESEALEVLSEMKKFANRKLKEEAKIDYFATSLPLLLVFEDDIQMRNTIEAYYLLGLADMGAENLDCANENFKKIIDLNASHIGARDYLHQISNSQIKVNK